MPWTIYSLVKRQLGDVRPRCIDCDEFGQHSVILLVSDIGRSTLRGKTHSFGVEYRLIRSHGV